MIRAWAVAAVIALLAGQADGPWEASPEEVALAEEVLDLLNDARSGENIAGLRRHPNLDHLAYQHAREMASRGRVTHHSYFFGIGTQTRFNMAFPRVRQFAENVALNRTTERLHTALQASTGHRLNRMDPAFTHVGIGVAQNGRYQIFLTELFARVPDETAIEAVDVLYTTLPPGELPEEDPTYGEVVKETIRVGAPEPGTPEYWTNRGLKAFDEGRYGDAVDSFRRTLALSPGNRYGRYNLSRALVRNDEPDAALVILETYLEQYADDMDAWAVRGAAALLAQRYELASDAYRRVLSDRARDAGSWYNFGLSQEMLGRYPEAERAFRQALHLDPDLTPAAAALARVQHNSR